MTDPADYGVSGDDLLAVLDRFSRDVGAANEAVLTRLSALVNPGRRSLLGRRRRADTNDSALLHPTTKVRGTFRPEAVPVAGVGAALWMYAVPAVPMAAELLPVLTNPYFAPLLIGGSVVAAAVNIYEGAPKRTRDTAVRLQETARAGVMVALETAALQVTLNDARSDPSRAAEILPKLDEAADRVNDALADYLVELDQAYAAGDLAVHFPWAVEPEKSPTVVRSTLTVDAESVRAQVRELVHHPEQLAPEPAVAAPLEATTADALMRSIDTLVATVEEAGERADQRGAHDVRDAFAQAWTEGMFAFSAVTEVRRSGAAASGTIEEAVRRFTSAIAAASATQPQRQTKFFSAELRERVVSATAQARHLILSAQYLDAMVRTPAIAATPTAAQPSVRPVHITVQEVAALATELRRAIATSARRAAELRPAVAAPRLAQRLDECASAAAHADAHLEKLLEHAGLAGVAPTAATAISILAKVESELDGAVAACATFDLRIGDSARIAGTLCEYDPTGYHETRAVLESLDADRRLAAAINLTARWKSLLEELEQLAARE